MPCDPSTRARRLHRSPVPMLGPMLGLLLVLPFSLTAANLLGCAGAANAQEWRPVFPSEQVQPRQRRSDPPPPETSLPTPPAGPYQRPAPRTGSGIERMDLEPVMSGDASGLPMELWRGLDGQALEALLAALDLPPRSPVLHQIWRRLLSSSAAPPAGLSPEHFAAVRLEALYRSGLLSAMADPGSGAAGVVVTTILARKDIGSGNIDAGCQQIKSLADPRAGLPDRLRGEAQLLAGFCLASAGDKKGAGLAASLAREEGLDAELPLTALAGYADDVKPQLKLPKRVLLLDYRFLALLGPVNARQVLDRAEPALLAVLAADRNVDAATRAAAAEAALRLNALAPDAVAQLYQELGASGRAGADTPPGLRHAHDFATLGPAQPGAAQALQSMMRDARRAGFGVQMGQVVATRFAGQPPSRQDSAAAETLAEAMLAAGKVQEARAWAQAGVQGLPHWMALIDVVDPARKSWRFESLGVLEDMAIRNRLAGDLLVRLATVLDALDIDVPVPLWDAANRAQQSSKGFLPETGVLAELAEASKKKEAARTLLLVMRALGPDGAEGANILPLGDSIRALRRIGLETEARRIALEALLPLWPRYAP